MIAFMNELPIWSKCINCRVNCCKQKEISRNPFLTKNEKGKLSGINDFFRANFWMKKDCAKYTARDLLIAGFILLILKKSGGIFWVYYQTNCPIIENINNIGKQNLELCLKDFELKLLPNFRKYIKKYSRHKIK